VSGDDSLKGVSCTSPTFCIVAGFRVDGPGRTLIEQWDGVTWTRVASPNVGSRDSRLYAVTCLNPTSCVAVGDYGRSGLYKALAEKWDGASWTITPSESPRGKHNILTSVSCVNTTTCFAVGQSQKTPYRSKPLIESFDGTSWTIDPSPHRFDYSYLMSVSCTSATNCTAVGGAETVGVTDSFTLVVTWDGVEWSRSTARNPGDNGNVLYGVTCTSSTNCVAVGEYYTGPHNRNELLIESWNGTTWSKARSPKLSGGRKYLWAVACSTESTCAAVGWAAAFDGALVVTGS
jgi:hypothetical protein